MAGRIDARLTELGIDLPVAPTPKANYVPFVSSGNQVFIAGQVPTKAGELAFKGRLGDGMSVEEGQAAARSVAINILSQLKAACDGDLDRVKRCLRLGGFVACTPEFGDHPKVINGASDLLVEVFGEAGRHTRAAVGTTSLPFGVAVEIDAIFEVTS